MTELEDMNDIELGYEAGVRSIDAHMVSGWYEAQPLEDIRVELRLMIRQHDAVKHALGDEEAPSS